MHSESASNGVKAPRAMRSVVTGQKADSPQISRIKERVEEKEGIPPAQQRLIYGGKQM
jgi:hypothetical protein